MTTPIAIWDWEREPQPPNARVAVCRPWIWCGGLKTRQSSEMWETIMRSRMSNFVVPINGATDRFAPWPAFMLPALYAERQADLASVSALLSVQAERRALVLCPREAMALHFSTPMSDVDSRARSRARRSGIDLVVIIPPEVRTCSDCHGAGSIRRDRALPPGPDPMCEACHGRPMSDPWPMHPTWVRGIVEQCRAADVPVAFLGWGEWFPRSQMSTHEALAIHRFEVRSEADERFIRTTRSGLLLDGTEFTGLPEWLA